MSPLTLENERRDLNSPLPQREDFGPTMPGLTRLPPQNLDAERAVLGAVLLDREALGEIGRAHV